MGTSKYKESAKGVSYHLYNRGNRKQIIFEGEEDYRLYVNLLNKYCKETSFSIIAYCLMPNHIHLLLRQEDQDTPAKLMSRLHTAYAVYYNKKYKSIGHLFQGRYKQKIIKSDNYLIRLVSYIHRNPVKDMLVEAPEGYSWSSFRQYKKMRNGSQPNGVCSATVIKSLGLIEVLKFTEEGMRKSANQLSPYEVFETDRIV